MPTKTYIASTRLTVPFILNGKIQRYISFKDEKNTFTTDDKTIQEALENLPLFNKHFKLLSTKQQTNTIPHYTTGNAPQQPPGLPLIPQLEIMEQITDWQSAREILKSHPYNVPYQALGSPEAILKKAEENKISFPNLHL